MEVTELDTQLELELDAVIVSGGVSARLAELVHLRARLHIGSRVLAEDVAQHGLTKLVEKLPKLKRELFPLGWLTMTLTNEWRYRMRQRRTEQRYLGWAVERLLDDLPVSRRGAARGKARSSMRRVLKLKFY